VFGLYSEAFLPICNYLTGQLARVVKYVRPNKRCPANDFLGDIESKMRKRFDMQFDAISKTGATYINSQRFRPLQGAGKPLWEFKEHDHRLYCFRKVEPPNAVIIVLFSGWIKQKSGKTDKENREIEHAHLIYSEFINEYEGGKV
jgi:hypothetical protein